MFREITRLKEMNENKTLEVSNQNEQIAGLKLELGGFSQKVLDT
jgi:hypothetical protein